MLNLKQIKFFCIGLIFYCSFITLEIQANPTNQYQYSNKKIRIRLLPRSPEQIAAFYEGRGFSKEMVNKLKQVCFITTGIHNKTQQILWHNLTYWHFTTKNGDIKRYTRHYWKNEWEKMGIPLAHQSTFRWTLLPDALDFRANEHEGGNIILPFTAEPFTLTARFKTGKDKAGMPIEIKIENLQCRR